MVEQIDAFGAGGDEGLGGFVGPGHGGDQRLAHRVG